MPDSTDREGHHGLRIINGTARARTEAFAHLPVGRSAEELTEAQVFR